VYVPFKSLKYDFVLYKTLGLKSLEPKIVNVFEYVYDNDINGNSLLSINVMNVLVSRVPILFTAFDEQAIAVMQHI